MLFSKGAFRKETLPVDRAGLLDRTVAELTDAPDRRGEKARRLPALNQKHPPFDHMEQACLYFQACGKGTSGLQFPSHLCVSNNLSEQRAKCTFSEYNLFLKKKIKEVVLASSVYSH